MRIRAIILLFVILVSGSAKSGWKTTIEKKPNPVTGQRMALMSKDADGLSVADIVIGCANGKAILRVAENFSIANGLNDAFTKSPLQQDIEAALQIGLNAQKHGFAFTVKDGNLYTRIKLRIDNESEYLDAELPMGYNKGTYFALLEDSQPGLIRRILSARKVVAELPYKDKPGFATWTIEGAKESADILQQAGCSLPY